MSRRLLIPMVACLGVGAVGLYTVFSEDSYQPSTWYQTNHGEHFRELLYLDEGESFEEWFPEYGENLCVVWRTPHINDLMIAIRNIHHHKPSSTNPALQAYDLLSANQVRQGYHRTWGFITWRFGSPSGTAGYIEVKAGAPNSPLCSGLS